MDGKNGTKMVALSLPVVVIILGALATLLTSSLLAYSDVCVDIRGNSENIKSIKYQQDREMSNLNKKIDELREDIKNLNDKIDKMFWPFTKKKD